MKASLKLRANVATDPIYTILKAQESKSCHLENSIVPKYKIAEYDIAAVKATYEEIQFIMAAQGYQIRTERNVKNAGEVYHIARKGISAFGTYDGEQFEVLEGSEISFAVHKSLSAAKEKMRKTALQSGDILERDGKFYLSRSMQFSSPSSAAVFVLGTSADGWREWRNKQEKTLDERWRK